MKPLTRHFKHDAQMYCDCLNKIIWKIPLVTKMERGEYFIFTSHPEAITIADRLASESTDRLQMNGNPYAIAWSVSSEKFYLYKPKHTPDHVKKVL